VTTRTAANRYARALFDVGVTEQSDLQAIEQQLAAFVDLVRQHATLEKVLLNPAVPAPRKRAAVAALVKGAGFLPMVEKLLVLLAERDRLMLLTDLLEAYRDRLLDHQNIVRADVATAAPLSPDRANAIERSLAQVTGRIVRLSTRIEPALIGGVVARVGGTVYDASVSTQLQKMRQKLTAESL
jgi:F-type H+-transporting ATPase subunit delta